MTEDVERGELYDGPPYEEKRPKEYLPAAEPEREPSHPGARKEDHDADT